MINRIYGYGRISDKDQNEARQIKAFVDAGIDERFVLIDKQSGKDFQRPQYQILKNALREGDLLIKQLLVEHKRIESPAPGENIHINCIQDILNSNYNSEINFRELSKLAGYSYDHFRHLFKQKTGFSPKNYILNKKIELAKILLANSELTIAEIAQKCSFSTNSQFCSLFKKVTGKTPSEYRECCKAHS